MAYKDVDRLLRHIVVCQYLTQLGPEMFALADFTRNLALPGFPDFLVNGYFESNETD